jgi:hypothetical protein
LRSGATAGWTPITAWWPTALEADWNGRLRALADAQEHYEQQKAADQDALDDDRREEILRLATDFPRLWRDPCKEITAHVRFKGGATRTLTLPLPLRVADLRRTDRAVVGRVEQLLDEHPEAEVVELLNREEGRTGTGLPFTPARLHDLRTRYGLKSRYQRLREQGLWTLSEMAQHLKVAPSTVHQWYKAGLLKAQASGGPRSRRLYEPPGPNPRRPQQGKRLVRTPPRQ